MTHVAFVFVTGVSETLTTYAIVRTGGKQYRVQAGDTIRVESLPVFTGEIVSIDDVLMVAQDSDVTVGTPVVEGARVRAQVTSRGRGRKVIVFKYKPKVRYRSKRGHRQPYTDLRVIDISLDGEAVAAVEEQEILPEVVQEEMVEATEVAVEVVEEAEVLAEVTDSSEEDAVEEGPVDIVEESTDEPEADEADSTDDDSVDSDEDSSDGEPAESADETEDDSTDSDKDEVKGEQDGS